METNADVDVALGLPDDGEILIVVKVSLPTLDSDDDVAAMPEVKERSVVVGML